MIVECRHCGARNPKGFYACARCRRSLAGAPLAVNVRDPSWGKDIVERARERREPTIDCASCEARVPERYVRCPTCRGSVREVERASHLQCPSCERWNERVKFCEHCGDPMTETGDPARWRPDGCPGCYGDVVPQPGLQFCGTCGAKLPATLLERRALLREVVARRVHGGYRGGDDAPPELHSARCELIVRHDEATVWLSLTRSTRGVLDLDVVAEHGDGEGPRPETPSSLMRLALWVRARLLDPVRVEHDEDRAIARDFCNEDEEVIELARAGDSLHVRIECRRTPSAERLNAWLEALRGWAERVSR